MAWSIRNNCRYYYRAQRVNGRPHRIYLGHGPAAEQAAQEVEDRKQQRAKAWAQVQADQQQHGVALQSFLDLAAQTDALFRSIMEANGYHQHCSETGESGKQNDRR